MTPEERAKTPKYDYLAPIIADADAGFGGITSMMKLTKMFIEAGAGGIHIEDQKPGVKKCGHLGGKVLVSCREDLSRLQAARLQADVMGADLMIVARCDALSATFLDNNIDPNDHPFILGCVDEEDKTRLMTFPEAGRAKIAETFTGEKHDEILQMWDSKCLNLSLKEGLAMAEELGFSFYFNWEDCRSDEGYYRIKGCIDYCVKRGLLFSDYADLLWMETPTPDFKTAKAYSDGIHAVKPDQMLAYNLSPSFNWDAANYTSEELAEFIPTMAKMGFCW